MTGEKTRLSPEEGFARGLGSRVWGERVVGGQGWQTGNPFFPMVKNWRVHGLLFGVWGLGAAVENIWHTKDSLALALT